MCLADGFAFADRNLLGNPVEPASRGLSVLRDPAKSLEVILRDLLIAQGDGQGECFGIHGSLLFLKTMATIILANFRVFRQISVHDGGPNR